MKKATVALLFVLGMVLFSGCMGDMSVYTKSEQDEYKNDAFHLSEQETKRTMHLCDITFNDWFGNEKIILNFAEGKTDGEEIPSYSISYDESALTMEILLKNVNCDAFSPPPEEDYKNIASIDYARVGEDDFLLTLHLKHKISYRVDETKEYSMIVVCLVKK